jgi:hypothetical protein
VGTIRPSLTPCLTLSRSYHFIFLAYNRRSPIIICTIDRKRINKKAPPCFYCVNLFYVIWWGEDFGIGAQLALLSTLSMMYHDSC